MVHLSLPLARPPALRPSDLSIFPSLPHFSAGRIRPAFSVPRLFRRLPIEQVRRPIAASEASYRIVFSFFSFFFLERSLLVPSYRQVKFRNEETFIFAAQIIFRARRRRCASGSSRLVLGRRRASASQSLGLFATDRFGSRACLERVSNVSRMSLFGELSVIGSLRSTHRRR